MEVLQNIQTQSVYHHPEGFAKNFICYTLS